MLKRYELRSNKKSGYEGWAIIVIDTDIGFFAVVGDFGNYAYAWSHPGCEFRKFLIGAEPDYLHGKLMHGRPDKEVFDSDGTYAFVKESVDALKGEDATLYESETELLAEWSTFETLRDFEDWQERTDMGDVWEYHKTFPEPQCQAFCERVMPRFKKMLEEELAKEEQDKKDAAAIRAAGPALVAELNAQLLAEFPIPIAAPFTESRRCLCEYVKSIGVEGTVEVVRSPHCPVHVKTEPTSLPTAFELDTVRAAVQRAKEQTGEGSLETYPVALREEILQAFPPGVRWEQEELTVTVILPNGHRIPMEF